MKIKNLYRVFMILLLPCILQAQNQSIRCSSTTNLALNKSAIQVSTSNGGVASRAVDGNTDGYFYATPPSVSQTNWERDGWWEVDLGDVYQIDDIEVWNQTKGNTLEQYYVFVSEKPFESYDLQTSINDPSIFKYHYNSTNYLELNTVSVGALGRYVRVQRNGQGFVTLAELKVNGCEIERNTSCVPFVIDGEIINEQISTTYTIDLVNRFDTSLKTIDFEVVPNSSELQKYGRFLVRDSKGNVLLDEIQLRPTFHYMGVQASPNLESGGYVDSVKVIDTNGNNFYIPLSPSNAALSGSAGTVSESDLIYSAATHINFGKSVEIVIKNYLTSMGYVDMMNFETKVQTTAVGNLRIRFRPKHQPSGLWLGLKRDDLSLHYHKNPFTSNVSSGRSSSGGGAPFNLTYQTPCGDIRLMTLAILPGDINGELTDFNEIVPIEPPHTYTTNPSFTNRSIVCTEDVLKVINPNCNGITSYLWDSGATTQTIPDDGRSHTVQVTCECKPEPCITPDFTVTNKCKRGDEANFYMDVVVTEGNNVPYLITNDINSSSVTGYLNESVEVGPFPNNSSVIVFVTNSMDPACRLVIADFSGDCSPCADEGGDRDEDGVCDNQDCDSTNSNLPASPGTTCDDGDPRTNNDVILMDGCTCQGSTTECVPPDFRVSNKCRNYDTENFYLEVAIKGGSGNTFYITNNADSSRVMTALNKPIEIGPFSNNRNVSVKVTSTNNEQCSSIQKKKTWVCTPCVLSDGDSDGDGICDTDDCDIWNPTLPGTIGQSCDDNNPNTENDLIIDDNCNCEGTLIPGSTTIIPSCDENAGSIIFDENCAYSSFEWDDGNTELNRENLPAGDYTVSITDKNGCIEELTYNIPDITNCNFEAERIEIINEGSGFPCFYYVLTTATINNQPIPSEFLQISWAVGGSGIITYYSNGLSIEVNNQAEWLTLDVSIVLPAGVESCCTYAMNVTFTDADYCVFDDGNFLTSNDDKSSSLITARSNSNTEETKLETTNLENPVLSSLEVYPNPFNEYLNVAFQSETEGNGQILVFNSIGKLVYTSNVYCSQEMQRHQIDFGTNNVDGLYLIQIHYPNGQVKSAKAIYVNHK